MLQVFILYCMQTHYSGCCSEVLWAASGWCWKRAVTWFLCRRVLRWHPCVGWHCGPSGSLGEGWSQESGRTRGTLARSLQRERGGVPVALRKQPMSEASSDLLHPPATSPRQAHRATWLGHGPAGNPHAICFGALHYPLDHLDPLLVGVRTPVKVPYAIATTYSRRRLNRCDPRRVWLACGRRIFVHNLEPHR